MVVLECSKERWVTKTSPGFAALVLSECPWTPSTKCQNRPPSMAVGKTKPYKNPPKHGNIICVVQFSALVVKKCEDFGKF